MSFTVDYKLIGAWNRDFSVRSTNKGKMTAKLYWSKSHVSIHNLDFHKINREDRPLFVSALLEYLKTLHVPIVSTWMLKRLGNTAQHAELLKSLGFNPYHENEFVVALNLELK